MILDPPMIARFLDALLGQAVRDERVLLNVFITTSIPPPCKVSSPLQRHSEFGIGKMIASLGELLLDSRLLLPPAKKGLGPQNPDCFRCCFCDWVVVPHVNSSRSVSTLTPLLQYPFPSLTQLEHAWLWRVQPARFSCPGVIRAVVLSTHDRFHLSPLPDDITPPDRRLKFPLRKISDKED
jgi:hypothetical protein